MVILLSAILGLGVVSLVLAGYATIKITRKYERLQSEIASFFCAPAEGELSPAAKIIDSVSANLSSRMAGSLIAGLRGAMGGTAKGENAQAMAEMAEGNPALGLITAVAPGLSRKLGKNPMALAGLQALLGSLGGRGSASGGNGYTEYAGRKHRE